MMVLGPPRLIHKKQLVIVRKTWAKVVKTHDPQTGLQLTSPAGRSVVWLNLPPTHPHTSSHHHVQLWSVMLTCYTLVVKCIPSLQNNTTAEI